MSIVNATLLYLLVSRLTIIAAGIVSMVLGYKLFCKGIGITATSGQGSTIESSMARAKISVKNAAPGTAFALFGAILVIVMLIQSSPSVTMETMSKWKAGSDAQQTGENTETTKLAMRGNDQNSISSLTLAGKEYERQKDTANAERSYREAVTQIAEPINDLAWLYVQAGKKDAIGLARLAVQLSPGEPRYADTLSKATGLR